MHFLQAARQHSTQSAPLPAPVATSIQPAQWVALGSDVVIDPTAEVTTRVAECSSPDVAQLAAAAPKMLALLLEAQTGAYDTDAVAHAYWLGRVEQLISDLARNVE